MKKTTVLAASLALLAACGGPSSLYYRGVKPMNELLPLERVSEAYDRMMSGKARFRVVLTTGS